MSMMNKDRELIRKAMSLIGSIKSKRKAAASKRNGKLGGRPKKDKSCKRSVASIVLKI